MINVKHLKENQDSLDQSKLSPLEKGVLAYFNHQDYEEVIKQSESLNDPEYFELIRHILGGHSPELYYDLEKREIVFQDSNWHVFMLNRKVNVEFSENEVEFLLDMGKVEIPLKAEFREDSIFGVTQKSMELSRQSQEVISKIQSAVKSAISWNTASHMMMVAVLGLSMSSCSKSVTSANWPKNNLTPSPGIDNPGIGHNDFLIQDINFSNHAEIGTNDELYTSHPMTGKTEIELPNYIDSFSFKKSQSKPYSLHLYLSGEHICSYVLVSATQYDIHPNCTKNFPVNDSDALELRGFAAGQTVTLKLKSR